jgi:hypothetical protein
MRISILLQVRRGIVRCAEFKKHIYEFIEDEIDFELQEKMKRHLSSCEACEEAYERKKNSQVRFALAFDTSKVEFNSSRSAIMERIKEESYKSSFSRRASYNLKKNWAAYASLAAVITLMFFIPKLSLKDFNGLSKSNTSLKSEAQDIGKGNGSATGVEVNVDKAVDDVLELRNSAYSEMKVIGDKQEISNIMAKLKDETVGVAYPEVVYSDKENIAFYNDRYLFLYRDTKGFKGIYSIIDFRGLDLGGVQGSFVIDVKASQNGQYYIIQSMGMDDDIKNRNVYLVDMLNKRSNIISKDYKYSRIAFSNSSKYLAFGNLDNRTAGIVDLKELNSISLRDSTSGEIKLNIPSDKGIEKIYVSDERDIFIKTDSQTGYILREKNSYAAEEINSQEELLSAATGGFIIFKEGALYIKDNKGSTKLKDIGEGCKVFQVTDENIIFNKEDKKFLVYNIKSNKVYEFIISEKLRPVHENGLIRFNTNFTLMKLAPGTTINNNGGFIELSSKNWMSDSAFMDDGIAYIDFTEEMKLGKFTIYKQDIKNKRKVVLYDSTK